MALPKQECERDGCSVVFQPVKAGHKYHVGACRTQAGRDKAKARRMAGGDGSPAPDAEAKAREQRYREAIGPLVENVRAALAKAGVEGSPAASAVLALAVRIEDGYHESGPALAALTKAFDAGMASAVASAEDTGDAAVEARRSMQQARFRLAARRAG